MRPIKYQAWHKRDRKMYHVATIMPDVRMVMLQSGDTLFSASFEEVELRQFTGLVDKNGKDGYATDLTKMFDRSLFAIIWNDYYARFQLELVEGDEPTKVWDMEMFQFSEIVGNIYEHPELIAHKE